MDGPVDNPMDNIPVAHRLTTGRPQLTHHGFIWITVIILIFFNHPETGSDSSFQAHLWIGIWCPVYILMLPKSCKALVCSDEGMVSIVKQDSLISASWQRQLFRTIVARLLSSD
jgi:hypothetical protein